MVWEAPSQQKNWNGSKSRLMDKEDQKLQNNGSLQIFLCCIMASYTQKLYDGFDFCQEKGFFSLSQKTFFVSARTKEELQISKEQ